MALSSCHEKNYSSKTTRTGRRFSEFVEFAELNKPVYYNKKDKRFLWITQEAGRIYFDSATANRNNKSHKKERIELNAKRNFDITFTQYQKMSDDNLMELVVYNQDLIKKQVNYLPVEGANFSQRLFIKEMSPGLPGEKTYIYHSYKYADATVLNIGQIYLGTLDTCLSFDSTRKLMQIKFDTELICMKRKFFPAKREPYFKVKPMKAPVIFCAAEFGFDKEHIIVERIILNGDNKIGGAKPLVYRTDTLLGHPLALQFLNRNAKEALILKDPVPKEPTKKSSQNQRQSEDQEKRR